ncbi:MAG TPA: TAT-variant-translocated molybdopterin oxidoreductase [Pyrinomonadaceae bacterium]|nr:TAT-variant-translocated molybdopterin oxidoreductase [Pyrinomonadaceae bacterium]
MPGEERHINFSLMRQYILDQQRIDEAASEAAAPVGKLYWRSLEEFADTPAFQEFVRREYPGQAENWDDPIERRTFLKLMGASLALAGLSGCVYQPPEKIVPYIRQPEGAVPGKPLFFATAATVSGIATPVLARSNEGRPTKIEGNADHPNSRVNADDPGSSATDLFAQASILSLYDPDRSQTLTYREEIRTWSTFVGEIRSALDGQRPKQGSGIRFLTETVTSPTLGAQLRETLAAFPQAKWHQFEPVNRDNARAGAILAFGQRVNTIYDFSKALRILSLDADFLSCKPGWLRYARDFAAKRRASTDPKGVSRLYVFESTPTNTGASADHHWAMSPIAIQSVANGLLLMLRPPAPGENRLVSSGESSDFRALANDLLQFKGASIVIPGDEQSPIVHAIAHAMNDLLGNVGQTVFYTDPPEANSVDQRESLADLVRDIDAGAVEMLVILGGNPAYNTPADLRLDFSRLSKVNLRVHLSQYKDETSELCHWHIPEAHYLESWSDTRAYDGTVSLVQPLIEPLYEGKTAHEVMAVFSDQYDRRPYDIVRAYWQGQGGGAGGRGQEAGAGSRTQGQEAGGGGRVQEAAVAVSPEPAADFETWWRKTLHDGYAPNTALPVKTVSLSSDWTNQLAQIASGSGPTNDNFDLIIRTDPTIYDGRFANNGWLQELPKPLTKLTWENVALVSPNTASRLTLENTVGRKGGDISVSNIRVESRGLSLTCPVWIMPGQPDNTVTIHLGYGRKRAGRVGTGHGFNAYNIRTSEAPWFASGVKVEKASGLSVIAATQIHFVMEGRDIVRATTYDKYLNGEAPHGDSHDPTPDETLYDNPFKYEGYAWGMAIDANSCVGCNACIVACQSENNIPIVGKEQIERSREMHWLRVDTYFQGNDASHPEGTSFMPVPCMHCENAPCEPVCPVHATVHSAEGLNDMVYNRCVGTRYCSNNCPYKVRRFNFLLYQDWEAPTYQLMRNPEVSVRSRGVMEKCTYCVQRIQAAKIGAELENRPVRDGEIVTACQAVCPTEAIVFGDINDPNSRVSKLKAEKRNYSLLADLNTRPRTTYLAVLRNPNPEISTQGSGSHGNI